MSLVTGADEVGDHLDCDSQLSVLLRDKSVQMLEIDTSNTVESLSKVTKSQTKCVPAELTSQAATTWH